MTRPHRRPLRIRLWPIVISLLLTLIASIALAIYFTPDAIRWINLRRLTSEDTHTRARGMAYVAAHANAPAVQDACRDLFERDDPELTRVLVHALRRGNVWDIRFGRPWLDYMGRKLQAHADSAAGRAWVAIELGQSAWTRHPVTADPAYGALVGKLLEDEEPAVRLAAVRAAATLPAALRDSLLLEATKDDEPTVARHAWTLIGIAWQEGIWQGGEFVLPDHVSIPKMHEAVACAYLWAEAQFNRGRTGLAYPLLSDEVSPQPLKNFAPYPLAQSPEDHARESLLSLIRQAPQSVEDPKALGAWRAMLAVEYTEHSDRFLGDYVQHVNHLGESVDVLAAAAASRLNGEPKDWSAWSGDTNRRWRELARLEAAPVASLNIPRINEHWPYLTLIYAVRASKNAVPDDLMPAFNADVPAMRQLGCLIAIERFQPAQLNALTEKLLKSYWDNQRIAGCLLAALRGTHVDLLRKRSAVEQQWHVKQCFEMALLMLGDNPDYAGDLSGLMVRKDIDRHFIYIAMLRTGDRTVLDDLFIPFGGDGGRLRAILDDKRFHPFLKMHLPDMPPFWLWADPALQQFQTDVIRDWYLIHRPDLRFDSRRKQFVLTTQNTKANGLNTEGAEDH